MKPNNARTEKMNGGPPGWMVESRPRTNEKYLGKIDWFYYEPGTGKQYRSHSKAWARYYETQQQIVVFVPKEETAHNQKMEFATMKDKARRFNVSKMPDSVTWVLTDTEYNKWATYIEDEMVLEDEQILWAETFEFAMVWKHWPDSEGDQAPEWS